MFFWIIGAVVVAATVGYLFYRLREQPGDEVWRTDPKAAARAEEARASSYLGGPGGSVGMGPSGV
jgi:hypothetical protein